MASTTRKAEPWDALLEAGRADERLVREANEGARPPVLDAVPPLHPKLIAALEGMGVEELYSHQVEAVHAAMEGDFIVTTGTDGPQGSPEVTAEQGMAGLTVAANLLAWPALKRKAYRLNPSFAT